MSTPLAERLADHTRGLILAAAIDLLEEASVTELTVRAVAARAGISERTVFRYFATRDDFLAAVAAEVALRLDLPPAPAQVEDLPAYVGQLYGRFEARSALTRAALHTEIYSRMRDAQAQARWEALQRLVDAHAPGRSDATRRIAAANLRYLLSATTWNYYRVHFGFGFEETVACVQTAVRQAVEGLSTGGR